ncbi:MAG: class I SAM-dependent methyltransferase [Rhodospirillales bacterium]|nr:class I SAM-dependent methyltransferase [Rhodospirillales bacterium]
MISTPNVSDAHLSTGFAKPPDEADRATLSTSLSGGAAPVKSLGPVTDLERQVEPDWWRRLFGELYLKTDGDVVENALSTKMDVDYLIAATSIRPDSRVLDLCCGQGRHLLELWRRGFRNLTGLDYSEYLLRLGDERARAEKMTIGFIRQDILGFRPEQASYDCICLMGNSFGYFDREECDVSVLKFVHAPSQITGVVVLDIADGEWLRDNFEARSWEWIDSAHLACRERCLSAERVRLVSRELVIHLAKGVIADQFYAERLYSFEHIRDILLGLGFVDIQLHDARTTESNRNQDLGMLARRLFITARVVKN